MPLGVNYLLENVFDFIIHIEPGGDTAAEPFGLSEDAMLALSDEPD